jgi:hypothetical protein
LRWGEHRVPQFSEMASASSRIARSLLIVEPGVQLAGGREALARS